MDTIQSTPSYALIYSGSALTATLYPSDGLTVGVTYRFILTATNEYGASDYSEETRVALGILPPQPDVPYKVESLSTETSIYIQWDAVTSTDGIDITGY